MKDNSVDFFFQKLWSLSFQRRKTLILPSYPLFSQRSYVKYMEESVRKLNLRSTARLTGFLGATGTMAPCFPLHSFQSPRDHPYWEIKLTLPSREARDYLYSSSQKLSGPVCSILGISHGASTCTVFALCLLV